MKSICSRCGTEIKHVFRVKGFAFGSECIQKMTQDELNKILGYFCFDGLKQAVLKEGKKRQTSFPESLPAIGAKAKFGTSTLKYEVVSYSKDGIKVSAIFKGRKTISTVKWHELLGQGAWVFDLP